MLVNDENNSTTSTSIVSVLLIGALIIAAIIGIATMTSSGGNDDNNCKKWGVMVDDHGKLSWAPTSHTPKNREDAEYIAKNLETQDQSGRYYYAKCKEYK